MCRQMLAELRGYLRAQVSGGIIAEHANRDLADIAATANDVHQDFNVRPVRGAAQRYTGDTKVRRRVGSSGFSDTSDLIDREYPLLFHERSDRRSGPVTSM